MPFLRQVDDKRRLILVSAEGDSDLTSTVAAVHGIGDELTQRPGYGLLVDARTLRYAPSMSEIRSIVDAFQERRSLFECGAAFVVEDALHFGLGRILTTLGDLVGLRMEVFRELGAAERWLESCRR